jgi:hypothetical protein
MRQVAIALLFTIGLQIVPASELDAVLQRAADYIATYEREITAVSADEDYDQRIPIEKKQRRLRSHLVLVDEPATGWVEFRDVFEVDGKPVRDREERLVRLFLTPRNDQLIQAAQIVEESARFNISPGRGTFRRTLNVPMTALRFLRAANQSRSTFELHGKDRQNGRSILVVRFKEQAMPRLIASNEGSPAKGQFWIDSTTGAVIRSELEMIHDRVAGKLTVKYADHATVKLWLPEWMDEVYTFGTVGLRNATIYSHATYANFKRFKVETSTTLK